MNKSQLPAYINTIGNTIEKIEGNNYKSLEVGETFVNNLNKHILFKIDYINAMGIYSYYFDVLKLNIDYYQLTKNVHRIF